MRDDIPLISVVMITYQHEKYIAEAVQSVLDQTFEDFELVIVNDGSTDKTDEIIRSFQDPRIKYLYQENQGPSAASNNGILKAQGKYVALMSGDDVCYPQRLDTQYQYLESSGKKIVFSWVDFIDDNSQIFVGEHFAQGFFNHPNRNRSEILNYFFFHGNYLCAVTAFIEKEILVEAGLFNLSSIQLQDFAMWIKLIKIYDIYLIDDKLVKYRIRSDSSNLSGDHNNVIRSIFEGYLIYKNMLDNISIDTFKLSFANRIKKSNFQETCEYEIEKAFLYLSHDTDLFKYIGLERLFNILQSQEILNIAKCNYGFNLPKLYDLTKDADITNVKKQHELERSQSQLQHTQSELERSQSQFQQIRSELERSQSQFQQIQSELEQARSESELERSQSQLQQIQSELEQAQSESELERSQSQLQQIQSELEQLNLTIAGVYASKFWKLRILWYDLKRLLGLVEKDI